VGVSTSTCRRRASLADFVRTRLQRYVGWPVFEVSTITRMDCGRFDVALWDLVVGIPAGQARGGAGRRAVR